MLFTTSSIGMHLKYTGDTSWQRINDGKGFVFDTVVVEVIRVPGVLIPKEDND